jgi:methionine salvage enolase-phosphatase E1
MTPEKIKQVCDRYLEEFKRWRPERHNTLTHADDSGAVMRHGRWMVHETKKLADEGRIEKAMRWLGFVQGTIWASGFNTIEQLKRHNMPDALEQAA